MKMLTGMYKDAYDTALKTGSGLLGTIQRAEECSFGVDRINKLSWQALQENCKIDCFSTWRTN
jgi:hypothetical protein